MLIFCQSVYVIYEDLGVLIIEKHLYVVSKLTVLVSFSMSFEINFSVHFSSNLIN